MVKKILLGLMTVLLLTGCASNVDKKYEVTNEQIEKANLQEDYLLFQDIQAVYIQNMRNTKSNDEKCVVVLKYVDDIFQLACNRYELDYDILSAFSEEYMEYVAACRVYSTTYLGERKKLIKDKKIYKEDYMKANTETGIMLVELERLLNVFNTQYKLMEVDLFENTIK